MATGKYFYLDTKQVWREIAISSEKLLGRGGQAEAYALSDDKVFKKYLNTKFFEQRKEELLNKTTIMAFRFQQFAGLKEQPLAWPLGPVIQTQQNLAWLRRQKTLQLDSSEFCGFVMPRVRDFSNLEDVISQEALGTRRLSGKDRVRILRRVAEAVQLCHDAEFIVGDINMRNIVVYPATLLPTIIDCDSFQYRKFPSHFGTIDFASPDLLRKVERNNGKFEGVLRNFYDDYHAMAVLIFTMCMNGRHPYDYANAPPQLNARISAIIERKFPYTAQSKSAPPTADEANRYRLIPEEIRTLLERVLIRGERVKAEDWISPLNRFAASSTSDMVAPPLRKVPVVRSKPAAKGRILRWILAALLVAGLIALLVFARKN